MEVLTFKIVAIISLFILAVSGGLLPLCLRNLDKDGRVLSLGNMLSAGIFLGGGLMHLLPEAAEGLEKYFDTHPVESFKPINEYPLAYFLCVCGFFTIMILEEVVLSSSGNGHSHGSNHKNEDHSVRTPVAMQKTTCCIAKAEEEVQQQRQKIAAEAMSKANADQSREFLRLYYSRREIAKGIVASLTPRSNLHLDSDHADAALSARRRMCLHQGIKDHEQPLLEDEEDSNADDGHNHSHIDVANTSMIVAYLLVLALSFHSVFEGIALGTQNNMVRSVGLFVAIAAHTPLAGFALGVSLVKASASTAMVISCILIFSATTPGGGILGVVLSTVLTGDTLEVTSAAFQAFSSGTFLFVAFAEIIPKEMASSRDKRLKLILCVVGFFMMAVLGLWAEPDDDD